MLDEYYARRFPHRAAFIVKFRELLEEHDQALARHGVVNNGNEAITWSRDGFWVLPEAIPYPAKQNPVIFSRELRNIVDGSHSLHKKTFEIVIDTAQVSEALIEDLAELYVVAKEEHSKFLRVALLELPPKFIQAQMEGMRVVARLRAIENNRRVSEDARRAELAEEFHRSYAILDSAGLWDELIEYSEKVLSWHFENKIWEKIYTCFYPRFQVHAEREQWLEMEILLLRACEAYQDSQRDELLGFIYGARANYWYHRFRWDNPSRLEECIRRLTIAERLSKNSPPIHAFSINTRGNIYRLLGQLDKARADYARLQELYGKTSFIHLGAMVRAWGAIADGNNALILLDEGRKNQAVKLLRESHKNLTEQADIAEVYIAHSLILFDEDPESAELYLAYGEQFARSMGLTFPFSIEQRVLREKMERPYETAKKEGEIAPELLPCEDQFKVPK